MKTKILIMCGLMLIFFIGLVSASNIENVGFNVSSEFKPIDDAVGLQFKDDVNQIHIRIMDEDSKSEGIDKMNSGFTKYDGAISIFNESDKVGSIDTYTFSCGEFVKLNGKKYWVEVSSDDIENPNYDKCLENLYYLNEHNHFEPIES